MRLFISSDHKFTSISLQFISRKLECGQSCFNVINIYRPPGPATTFFSALQRYARYAVLYSPTLSYSGANDWFQSSYRFLIIRLYTAHRCFGVVQYRSIFSHPHSWSFSWSYMNSIGCDVSSVSTSYLISDHISIVTDLGIPTNHSQTVPQTVMYQILRAIKGSYCRSLWGRFQQLWTE